MTGFVELVSNPKNTWRKLILWLFTPPCLKETSLILWAGCPEDTQCIIVCQEAFTLPDKLPVILHWQTKTSNEGSPYPGRKMLFVLTQIKQTNKNFCLFHFFLSLFLKSLQVLCQYVKFKDNSRWNSASQHCNGHKCFCEQNSFPPHAWGIHFP